MNAALVMLLFAAPISAGERTPAVMLVIAPKEVALRVPSSAFLDAASRVLEAETRLVLLPPERSGADMGVLAGCPPDQRFTCWLAAAPPPAKYLFVLLARPEELTLFFLDAELARGGGSGSKEESESRIFARAIQVGPVQVDSTRADALDRWFQEMLRGPLAAALDRSGDRAPLGRILLRAPEAGVPILLDAETIGATAPGATELRDVRPGSRKLAIAPPGLPPLAQDVLVREGRTATVSFSLELGAGDPPSTTLRYGLVFSGVVAAVLGGVFVVNAAERAGDVRQGCLARTGDPAECEDLGAITFGHDSAALPALDADRANPSGVPMAALGLGLIVHGAISAAGGLYVDEQGDLWMPLVLGLAAGAATFGAGALLGAR
jgi:hypothetical protein